MNALMHCRNQSGCYLIIAQRSAAFISLQRQPVTTTHDDYPHPVPALANLRWKENWLFVVMAPEQAVYGVVHVNTEPMYDRARFTCNMSVVGRLFKYAGETRFPASWEGSRELGDDAVKVRFTKPHERFELDIATGELVAHVAFERTHATFDFAACRAAAPDNLSFKELMTLGTNLPHDHQQQALSSTGAVQLRGAAPIDFSGAGYRDHSWCMRGDNLIAQHTFCGLLFPARAIGVKTAAMLARPATVAREGYVSDEQGARVLRGIDVEIQGTGPDGMGELVRFRLSDVSGQHFTVAADMTKRMASVPLVSEKPGAAAAYRIVDSLCPITLVETGETGLGHIELGINPRLA